MYLGLSCFLCNFNFIPDKNFAWRSMQIIYQVKNSFPNKLTFKTIFDLLLTDLHLLYPGLVFVSQIFCYKYLWLLIMSEHVAKKLLYLQFGWWLDGFFGGGGSSSKQLFSEILMWPMFPGKGVLWSKLFQEHLWKVFFKIPSKLATWGSLKVRHYFAESPPPPGKKWLHVNVALWNPSKSCLHEDL